MAPNLRMHYIAVEGSLWKFVYPSPPWPQVRVTTPSILQFQIN